MFLLNLAMNVASVNQEVTLSGRTFDLVDAMRVI